jgi:hypothetical protein
LAIHVDGTASSYLQTASVLGTALGLNTDLTLDLWARVVSADANSNDNQIIGTSSGSYGAFGLRVYGSNFSDTSYQDQWEARFYDVGDNLVNKTYGAYDTDNTWRLLLVELQATKSNSTTPNKTARSPIAAFTAMPICWSRPTPSGALAPAIWKATWVSPNVPFPRSFSIPVS